LENINETSILYRVTEFSRKNGKKINFSVLSFFMRLLTIAKRDSEGWFVSEAIKDLAVAVDMSVRTVSFCLKCLRELGIIMGRRGKPTVYRIESSILGVNEVFL